MVILGITIASSFLLPCWPRKAQYKEDCRLHYARIIDSALLMPLSPLILRLLMAISDYLALKRLVVDYITGRALLPQAAALV